MSGNVKILIICFLRNRLENLFFFRIYSIRNHRMEKKLLSIAKKALTASDWLKLNNLISF